MEGAKQNAEWYTKAGSKCTILLDPFAHFFITKSSSSKANPNTGLTEGVLDNLSKTARTNLFLSPYQVCKPKRIVQQEHPNPTRKQQRQTLIQNLAEDGAERLDLPP